MEPNGYYVVRMEVGPPRRKGLANMSPALIPCMPGAGEPSTWLSFHNMPYYRSTCSLVPAGSVHSISCQNAHAMMAAKIVLITA